MMKAIFMVVRVCGLVASVYQFKTEESSPQPSPYQRQSRGEIPFHPPDQRFGSAGLAAARDRGIFLPQ